VSESGIPQDLTESFQPIIGQAVTVRPLRREDLDIESAFVRGLSPESRYNRLLGGMIALTPEYFERLTRVDYRSDMALAATVMLEGEETLIGVARYAREADEHSCEFALVIADAWQGIGIGRRLLAKLIAVARARGYKRMIGDVLSSNRPMQELVKKLGFRLQLHPQDATVMRATLEL